MAKGLIRSLNRRGARSDQSPPVAQKQKFSEPSICDRCGAVYSGKTWRRGRRLSREVMDKARWVECPGCAQAASGKYYGQVLITLADADNRDALLARIANVESRALATQPERRIVARNWEGETLEVLTTSQKLAHRIAHEIEKVFGGKARFSWSDGDGALRATLKTRPRPSTAKMRTGKNVKTRGAHPRT
jgi:NMD protein affecting ribosome stability and mRNA decay